VNPTRSLKSRSRSSSARISGTPSQADPTSAAAAASMTNSATVARSLPRVLLPVTRHRLSHLRACPSPLAAVTRRSPVHPASRSTVTLHRDRQHGHWHSSESARRQARSSAVRSAVTCHPAPASRDLARSHPPSHSSPGPSTVTARRHPSPLTGLSGTRHPSPVTPDPSILNGLTRPSPQSVPHHPSAAAPQLSLVTRHP
jgi:hypothetical protein